MNIIQLPVIDSLTRHVRADGFLKLLSFVLGHALLDFDIWLCRNSLLLLFDHRIQVFLIGGFDFVLHVERHLLERFILCVHRSDKVTCAQVARFDATWPFLC